MFQKHCFKSSRSILTEISGEELLNKIISEGISAEYTTEQNSHDLVGNSIYTHRHHRHHRRHRPRHHRRLNRGFLHLYQHHWPLNR